MKTGTNKKRLSGNTPSSDGHMAAGFKAGCRRNLHLAAANLRKKKGMAVTLIFLSLLATLFLNIGLNLQAELRSFYPACADRLASPDFMVFMDSSKYKQKYENFLMSDERVQLLEKEEIVYMENTENNANSSRVGAVIFNKDLNRELAPLHLLKEDKSVLPGEAIYLPKTMEDGGASLGERFTLRFRNRDYSFRVAGFFETTGLGMNGYAYMKYYVSDEVFRTLYETAGTGKALSARLKDGLPKAENSDALKKDFIKATDYYTETGGLMAFAACFSYMDFESNIASLVSVPIALLIAMAFIICIINFITVLFKVKEEIDESMTDIGSLQAMGYTTGQIILSEITEFTFIGAAGGAAGSLCTWAVMPFMMKYGESIAGIVMPWSVHPSASLISASVIIILMAAAAVTAAWKIRKLPPVTALRGGVNSYHFGKNFFPLYTGNQPLVFRLAMKNMCSDLMRNAVTVLSIALGVFAICLSVVLYANFGYDNSALARMTGIEIADVRVDPLLHADSDKLLEELASMTEVRKTNRSDNYMAKAGEEDLHLVISNDFKKTEMVSALYGELPEYDNEVVLTSIMMKKLNRNIGDTVDITSKGNTSRYLITGISSGTNSNGQMGLMTLEGINRIDPWYKLTGIDVYLKEGEEIQAFMDKLYSSYSVAAPKEAGEDGSGARSGAYEAARKRAEQKVKRLLEQYGLSGVEYAVMKDGEIVLSGNSSDYTIKEISSMSQYLSGQLASYAVMMRGIVLLILAVMFLVMGAIISISISSALRRQKTEFGIYKSLGFTTKELVNMVRLNFIIYAAAGSVIGAAGSAFTANVLFRAMFIRMGVDMGALSIHPVWLAAVGALTVSFICTVSTIKAYKIKKISVYGLLTE